MADDAFAGLARITSPRAVASGDADALADKGKSGAAATRRLGRHPQEGHGL